MNCVNYLCLGPIKVHGAFYSPTLSAPDYVTLVTKVPGTGGDLAACAIYLEANMLRSKVLVVDNLGGR